MKTSIPSEFGATRDIHKRIMDEVVRRSFSGESTFAIKLGLEEALNNAIRHGNQLDPEKRIHIAAKITDKQAEIIIEDEGPGFERTEVPDPTLNENLEKCSGRGILLIEAYMNEVEWSHGGKRLRMVKKNESDELAGG